MSLRDRMHTYWHDRLHTTRDRVRGKFESALEDVRLARTLERLLWNWTRRTCKEERIPIFWDNARVRFRYTTRALSLVYNLRHPKNPSLGDRVRALEIPLDKFIAMTPEEMFPGLYADIRARREAEKERMRRSRTHNEAPDGLLVCRSCKSKKTHYVLMQTRSADEPMTAFVSCLNCGRRWKE